MAEGFSGETPEPHSRHGFKKKVNELGYAFISAAYRLVLPKATVHEILEDTKDVLTYIAQHPEVVHQPKDANAAETYIIDVERIAVAGSSAGAWCAYLAAAHSINPKPKAVISIYGMAGNLLTSEYVNRKTAPFLFGQPLLDVESEELKKYLYPAVESVVAPSVGQGLVAGVPPPVGGRDVMTLVKLYLQLGIALDYYVGQHEPSLSLAIQEALATFDASKGQSVEEAVGKVVIPEKHQALFPQLLVNGSWPPTVLLHGTADTAVLIDESKNIEKLLKKNGVEAVLIPVEGQQHTFDLPPDAEEKWKNEFDQVGAFIKKHL